MPNKIIIPIPTFPDIDALSSAVIKIQSANEILANSPLLKMSNEIAKNAMSMHEKLNASALLSARNSMVIPMEAVFKNSAVVEMQKNRAAFARSIAQLQLPAIEAVRGILESMPKFVFQPVVYTTPKQNFQKPSIDLPSVIISDGKASLNFNKQVIELGNENTQTVKAIQYFCDHIDEEIDLAFLYMHCKSKSRGKITTKVSTPLSMDEKTKRGRYIVFEVYKQAGFSDIFTIRFNKNKITPVLAIKDL